MPRRRQLTAPALICVLAAAALGGCGQESDGGAKPVLARKGDQSQAARSLGFPAFATKNTTRVGGADAIADAAAVALAVYSGAVPTARPPAVTLVADSDWQAGIAASVLMSTPTRAPILLAGADSLPAASRDALATLKPGGAKQINGAQLIRVGMVASPSGLKATAVGGGNPFALAAAIDRLHAKAAGKPSDRVMVVSGERPEFAMPAASWAAKAGDPVLYVTRDSVPSETLAALKFHQQPKIYLLGPRNVISTKVEKTLQKSGTVRRIHGDDAITNAIAFARFSDGSFGWGVSNPGHGLVFASETRPLDAAAAAPLSATGSYAPLLLVAPAKLPQTLVQYLLDIQPGYEKDPVQGVYNHGWLIGDLSTISLTDQSRIDALLEIVQVNLPATPAAPAKPTTTPKPSPRKQTKTTPATKTTTLSTRPPPAPPRVTR